MQSTPTSRRRSSVALLQVKPDLCLGGSNLCSNGPTLTSDYLLRGGSGGNLGGWASSRPGVYTMYAQRHTLRTSLSVSGLFNDLFNDVICRSAYARSEGGNHSRGKLVLQSVKYSNTLLHRRCACLSLSVGRQQPCQSINRGINTVKLLFSPPITVAIMQFHVCKLFHVV